MQTDNPQVYHSLAPSFTIPSTTLSKINTVTSGRFGDQQLRRDRKKNRFSMSLEKIMGGRSTRNKHPYTESKQDYMMSPKQINKSHFVDDKN